MTWIGRGFLWLLAVLALIILVRDLIHDPRLFIQIVISGLQLGFVYALIALGYTMVYGIVRLINFAHGDVFMVGSFVSFYAVTRFALPRVLSVLAVYFVLALHYEWIHFLIHTRYPPRSARYRRLWRNHLLHHFKNEHYWYGVTRLGGDRVFGTAADPDRVPTSSTARSPGPAPARRVARDSARRGRLRAVRRGAPAAPPAAASAAAPAPSAAAPAPRAVAARRAGLRLARDAGGARPSRPPSP